MTMLSVLQSPKKEVRKILSLHTGWGWGGEEHSPRTLRLEQVGLLNPSSAVSSLTLAFWLDAMWLLPASPTPPFHQVGYIASGSPSM